MSRYKTKYGVTYEISGTETNSVLSLVHSDTKMLRRKPVTTERMQPYFKNSKDNCFEYLNEIETEVVLVAQPIY